MTAINKQLARSIVHVPHASTCIPPQIRSTLLLSDEALEDELVRLTDWYTDELFDLPDDVAKTVRYPLSRLVCDPERFADDTQEAASEIGMGCVYVKTSTGLDLRDTNVASWKTDRSQLIEHFYTPHHKALDDAVQSLLDKGLSPLIIDAHSFPDFPIPLETTPIENRPDICIGTDAFHTPQPLIQVAIDAFETEGFSVMVDIPFKGTITPMKYYRREKRVRSIMIELNRNLYLGDGSEKSETFTSIKDQTRTALLKIANSADSC